MSRHALAAQFLVLIAQGGMAMMRPQVVRTVFPTDDIVIASVVVEAPRDGKADATRAIQKAINEAAGAGGGVVFLVAGRYRLEGRLLVKEGVTLRGDWSRTAPPGKCTVLMPTADRGKPNATAAITLERGSGVREVVVWYPDQDPANIVPYPWTFRTSKTATGGNTTIQNVTLVNPYQAIQIGPEWNELHTVKNVGGTPLKAGIWIDSTTDIGRLIDVDFRPSYWEGCGLPGAPGTQEGRDALREFLLREGTAFEFRRSDWEYIYRIRAEGYATGCVFRPGQRGAANAVMFGCKLIGCGTALRLEGLNPIGLSVTACELEGKEYAVHATRAFGSLAQFNACPMRTRGKNAVLLEGRGTLTFTNCWLNDWGAEAVYAPSGSVSLLGCEFRWPKPHVRLGRGVRRARVLSCRFVGEPRIRNDSRGDVVVSHYDLKFARPDVRPHPSPPDPRPATRRLFVVTDFGASTQAADNTAAFAKALDAAREAGGGTVYVPAGNYRFAGELVVPTGVELRGCFDVPHHTVSGGSVLMPTGGKGNADGTPFIRLEPRSGLRGLTVWHPEQTPNKPIPYPWAIQALGPECWLLDVTLGNAYQGADFWTHPSEGHIIRYLAGAMLRRGLFVSKGSGVVEDVQFNPHYAARLHPSLPRPKGMNFQKLIEYQRANLEGIVFGRCENEHVRGTFLYAAHDGIAFRDDGGGANANVIMHGSDTVSRAAVLEAAGKRGVQFINAQLVPLSHREVGAIVVADSFRGRASFFNTQVWAGHVTGVIGGKGEVLLQGLHTLSGGISLEGGRARIENANFAQNLKPHIRVGKGVERAWLIASLAPAELRVANAAGDRLYARANAIPVPPPAARSTFRTGWEKGEPQGLANTIAAPGGQRKVSRAACQPAETDAHAGKRALRVAGRADDPAYSYVYFRVFDGPLAVQSDATLSYWIRPSNERGRCVGIDLIFTDGAILRDSRAKTSDGKGVHPGNPKGAVGKWTKVTIPLGRSHMGKVIRAIGFAYDSRAGGGEFEAWIDDVALESEQAGLPQRVVVEPKGGVHRGGVRIELRSPDGAAIRYTLDGTGPTARSLRYQRPIVLDKPGLWELRCAAQAPGGRISPRVFRELYELRP